MKAIIIALMLLTAATIAADDNKTEAVISDSAAVIQSDSNQVAKPDELKNGVVVYYFHGNQRCKTCLAIESYSHSAVEANFKDELKLGQLEFLTINRDNDENKHFNKDYELYTSSLILVKFKDGKQTEWKNLDKVWTLKSDSAKFTEYVKTEVSSYLKAE
ncbi:MAG: nitrophenyl compound nitroreductase subunit ArsF family protein [Candidatus Zixiibacteriota bacterium]